MDQPRRAFIFDLEQIHSASTAALPRRGARLPRHASGDVGHDGATGELFVKGGEGRAPGDIVLIFEGRYRCKWDPSNEAHRKRDLNLEIFAGELPRRRFFRVAKKESWRASPLLATKSPPREQAITSGSECDRHNVANCRRRNEVFNNVFVAFRCVRGQLSADDAKEAFTIWVENTGS